jgi:O-antigen/teichoic acid export membrane protein
LFLACLALPFLIGLESGRYLLYALNALHVFNGAQLAGFASSSLVLILTVMVLNGGVTAAFFSLLVSGIVTSTLSFWYIARRAPAVRFRWTVVRRLLRGSGQLHLNAIGTFLFTQASILILSIYSTSEQVGYYQLATQLFNMTLIIPISIGTVAFGLVAKRGADGAWAEHRKLLAQGLGIALLIGISGYILAPWAIPLIAGPEFAPAVPLFQILLIALFGATLSAVMASQWIGRGWLWQAAFVTLSIGLLSLAADFVLIPQYGMYGALVSTLLTYTISVVGNGAVVLWVERRWNRLQPSYT